MINYLYGIVLSSMFLGIIKTLLPCGRLSKVVSLIFGLIVLNVAVLPLSDIDVHTSNFNTINETVDYNYLQNNLYKNRIDEILRENGIDFYDIDITYSVNQYAINKITVYSQNKIDSEFLDRTLKENLSDDNIITEIIWTNRIKE